MITQDLRIERNLQGKKYIPLKNEVIKNSKFGKLSNNHSFTVEACFEHTLIHSIKSEYLEKRDIKTILECHPRFKKIFNMLNWAKNIEFSEVRNTILDYSNQNTNRYSTSKKVTSTFTPLQLRHKYCY